MEDKEENKKVDLSKFSIDDLESALSSLKTKSIGLSGKELSENINLRQSIIKAEIKILEREQREADAEQRDWNNTMRLFEDPQRPPEKERESPRYLNVRSYSESEDEGENERRTFEDFEDLEEDAEEDD